MLRKLATNLATRPHSLLQVMGKHFFIPALGAVLFAALWAYVPGLSGAFLFDDFANLPVLGETGPVHDSASFWRYITAGAADPTGRPIALLTFLLDAQDWPADPLPFKRTNVLIHLLNISLLALLLRRLSAIHSSLSSMRRDAVAVIGAAIWGLHPLLVSTTLYVVQREAMLPATFVLLGLLSWLRGRNHLLQARPRLATIWMIGGLGLFTMLAVLSKANGALLPLLAGVLEITVLRREKSLPADHRQLHRRLNLWLLLIPTMALVGYLLKMGMDHLGADLSGQRPWTLTERLLTQPRVLLDYLAKLLVPRPYSSGLFNDSFVVSRSLLNPASTLPALILVLAIPAWAYLKRQRHPIAAAAILFYFGGQLLESTTIPLELYFEHRNYLPAMLLGWPIAAYLAGMRIGPPGKLRSGISSTIAATALAGIALVGLTGMTHARASLWGDTTEQALVWGAMNPSSPRAQAYAAQAEIARGRPDLAIRRLELALDESTEPLQLRLSLINAYCSVGYLPPDVLKDAESDFLHTRNPGSLIVNWTRRGIERLDSNPCRGLRIDDIGALLNAAAKNQNLRKIAGRVQDLQHLEGLIALHRRDPVAALERFDAALSANPRPTLALQQAALLGSADAPDLAILHLDRWSVMAESPKQQNPASGMPTIHAWVLDIQNYWPTEIAHMRQKLQAAVLSREEQPAHPLTDTQLQ